MCRRTYVLGCSSGTTWRRHHPRMRATARWFLGLKFGYRSIASFSSSFAPTCPARDGGESPIEPLGGAAILSPDAMRVPPSPCLGGTSIRLVSRPLHPHSSRPMRRSPHGRCVAPGMLPVLAESPLIWTRCSVRPWCTRAGVMQHSASRPFGPLIHHKRQPGAQDARQRAGLPQKVPTPA